MNDELRNEVSSRMTGERFSHVLGVERAALRIAGTLCREKSDILSAAALLHDVTKELSFDEQLIICKNHGIILRDDEISAPAIIHAITAAAVIPDEFPLYATDEIVSCVRWHTTGHTDMTLTEKIICLSDYIEDGRQYTECRKLAENFWAEFNTQEDKIGVLNRSLLISLENTVEHIKKRGGGVNSDTLCAIEYLKTI